MRQQMGPQDPRAASITWWIERLGKARSQCYPTGLPTTGADDSVTNWDIRGQTGFALPAGISHITRYSLTNPGGRVGSTLYYEFCYPTVTPINRCLVFFGGDVQTRGWWGDYYCNTDGSSIITRAIAAGWHVLGVNMPGYPGNPNPELLTLAGVLQSIPNSHPYAAGYADGGPSVSRVFTDVIRVLNQITTDTGITRFSAVGHSSGACSVTLVAMMEDRFREVAILQPGNGFWVGSWPGESMADMANPTMQAGSAKYPHEWMSLVAARPGRRTLLAVSPGDEFTGSVQYDPWVAHAPNVARWIQGLFPSSSFTFLPKLLLGSASDGDPYHTIDATEATQVMSFIT